MIGRPSRASRRTVLLAGIVGLVAIVVVVGAVVVTGATSSGGPPTALPAPRFVDEAATAGIDHAYAGDADFNVGGGVAVFDCDGDGRPELYLAGGSEPAALYRNLSPVGGPLRFDRLASAATDLDRVTGAYPLDVDGDGRVDLAVLRYGENVLLRGLGGCAFERANEAWGFDGGEAWTTAFSAKWEPSAARPTLAFGTYVDPAAPDDADNFCADGAVVEPDGAGHGPPVALSPGWCALSMLFSDWDRSGRRDLRVSNDKHYYRPGSGEEQLWRIEAGQAPRPYGLDDGWNRLELNGMGIASYDVTGDGYPDYYLTNMGENRLQTLAAGAAAPDYRDIAFRRGIDAHQPFEGDTALASTAWHAEFQDVNADGYVDLFVAKGNVDAMPDFALRDPSNLLLGQPDGTFIEGAAAAGIVTFARARGAAVVDLDLDGLLDIVEVNRHENVELWHSLGAGDAATGPAPMGHWLQLRLEQPGPNGDAIGAWLEVTAGDRTFRRELTVGGGHAGGQLGWVHVGLGPAERASVAVTWPDGGRTGPLELEADGFHVIDRATGRAEPWAPAAPGGGGG